MDNNSTQAVTQQGDSIQATEVVENKGVLQETPNRQEQITPPKPVIQPEEPKPKQKHRLLIILGALLAFSVFSIFLSGFIQSRPKKPVKPAKSSATPVATQTPYSISNLTPPPTKPPFYNWKTHINRTVNYLFGYPPEWAVQNPDDKRNPYNVSEKTLNLNIIRLDEIGDYQYHLISIKSTLMGKKFVYDDWLNNLKGLNLDKKVISQEDLNGIQTDVIEGDNTTDAKKYHMKVYAFKSSYQDYAVSISIKIPLEEENKDVEKILSTFKFIEKLALPSPTPKPSPTLSPEQLF